MHTALRILAVIPARGGSKGVPRKNIQLVNGKPLIAYSIECALEAGSLFHRVIVSTDDDEIADLAMQLGADVPFLRPAHLATDAMAMVPVICHATEFVEANEGVTFDWVCILQPSAPLRTVHDLRDAVRLAEEGDADSVISVHQVFAEHPVLMKRIEGGHLRPFCMEEREGTRRQDLAPAAFQRNGAIYLTRRDVLLSRRSIWGNVIRPLIMPAERSINIDSALDLALVDVLMRGHTSTPEIVKSSVRPT